MTKQLQQKFSDSAAVRWCAILIVSVTMMCGYMFTDIMAPLEKILTEPSSVVYFEDGTNMSEASLKSKLVENPANGVVSENTTVTYEDNGCLETKKVDKVIEGKHWSSKEYGFFSGAYGFINVFLLMLFFGGLILDVMGIRFTGIMSTSFMIIGALIKYYAISNTFAFTFMGYSGQVVIAAIGFAIFGMGAEITGVTVSKIIVKWFSGKELALAMGLQVGLARLGTTAAMAMSLPVARMFGGIQFSILLGISLLVIGFVIYLVYCIMDKKEDASVKLCKGTESIQDGESEKFQLKDLAYIFSSPGFWLITLLCMMFYGGVFPFLKFSTNLMIFKYHVPDQYAGLIPSLIPIGTVILTPIFGIIYDRIGRGATLMIIGSVLLSVVHVLFALPFIESAAFAICNMILLGIAFSLVPSAMWPSVSKIIPEKQLGTAFALIFYIQNIGLSMIPILMGAVIEKSTTVTGGEKTIDYTLPMSIFALFGFIAIFIAVTLLVVDSRKEYGLEKANIQKKA